MKKEMHGGEGFLWVFGLLCLFTLVVNVLEAWLK